MTCTGTVSSYQRGCRCPLCIEASRDARRRVRANAKGMPDDVSIDWYDAAACKGADSKLFFPGRGDVYSHEVTVPEEAAKLCARCPVREPCLEFAIRTCSQGVWAGTSVKERRRMRRNRGRKTA